MSQSPRVSVISAWYNRAHDIDASLNSVLEQDGVDFEYIVVDDASTDDETIQALSAADAAHPRMVLHRNPLNQGFTRSMILAASQARGEFIAVHDAGDISLPGRLEKQQVFLDENPEHVTVGTGVEDLNVETGKRSLFTSLTHSRLRGVEGKIYSHGEVMFRADAYRAVGGYRPEFYYSQDTDLWRRLSEIGKLGHLEEILYERRIFPDGVSGNTQRRVAQAIFGNLALISAEARKAGKPDPVERFNSLSLLNQPHNRRFEEYTRRPIKHLLLQRKWDEAFDALNVVPAGLMTGPMLVSYTLLRMFNRGTKK